LVSISCKKKYTCECIQTLGSFKDTQTSENEYTSKKDALDQCKKNENLTGSPKVECELK
jgi:hypothetical protein